MNFYRAAKQLFSSLLEADIYLLSPEIGILAHPYDDRGMDLIGPNTTRLKEIFDTYYSWLLSYDLDAMNQSYGSPDVINGSDQV